MTLAVVDWRRAVEAAVEGYVPDEAGDVLDSVAFIESLDGALDLEGEDLDVAVREAVDAWRATEAIVHAPAGSADGGQFVAGGGSGGSKSGKGKSVGKAAPKPAGDLAYNGKTGAGYGMRGGDSRVHSLQQALNRLGIKDAQGQPLKDDGLYGPRTTSAVRSLQRRLGMQPTGVVTPELLSQITGLKSLPARRRREGLDLVGEDGPELVEPPEGTRVLEGVEEAEDTIEGRVLEARADAEDGGRVFRVRIIRVGDSKNGRRYTEAVLKRATPMYEGAKAYDHHRTADELRTSTIHGLVGSYRNASFEGAGIHADLHLLPGARHTAEALDASLAAQAQGLPPLVGISHDVLATYATVQAGGRRLQEATAITRVHSADVVADPAAGGIATRMVAGGVETDTEESDVTVTTEAVLDALKTAGDEQLAAVGLTRVTPSSTTESTEVRATEAGEPKGSMLVQVLLREKLADAGMSSLRESVLARLPERVTEADIDREVVAYKGMMADVERAGLRPTATAQVTQDAMDKKRERLDKFFESDFVAGYHSFRDAYMDITGYRPGFAYTEDMNRRILRESFGGGFDSGVRSTESVDTTTWAQVLGDSVTRRLVAAYQTPSLQTWRRVVSSIVPLDDFRTQRVGRVGGYGVLPTVAEGAPYQPLTSPPDEEATYALSKKGGTEDITLEQIANDDRRVIPQIPGKLGRAAAQTLYRFVFDFFATNPTATYDSVAWFHASHSNTTAAALSQSSLSAASVALMTATAYGDAFEVLGEPASLLIVPAALREIAFQLCRSAVAVPATPAGPSNTPNIHSEQDNLDFIVVPYFSDTNDWFAIADPKAVPTLEIGFYQGRDTPEIFTQADNSVGSVFNADVFTWKIRFPFSGTILDHRGVQRGTQ
jgi:peptidoglycan hydrolase-like protein with peptidoglycan-binding domain